MGAALGVVAVVGVVVGVVVGAGWLVVGVTEGDGDLLGDLVGRRCRTVAGAVLAA